MRIIVALKVVPDLVEDLEVDASGTQLDFAVLKLKLNEFDDHALEEALLLKEAGAAEVVVVAVDGDDTERVLFTALAKGADKAVRITGADPHADNHTLGKVFAQVIQGLGADLVLTGVQSAGDRDGQLAPILAAHLGLPVVSVVTGVELAGGSAVLKKEYAGGVMAEFAVTLPAVLGVQAARQAPRYAPVSKVRQVQQSASLDAVAAGATDGSGAAPVLKLEPPVKGQGAKMLGSAKEIVAILKDKGVL